MDTFSTTGKHMCTEILAGQVTTTAWDYRHKIDSSCHYAYQYDDIGNRQSAVEPNGSFSYAANALNQYTQLNRTIEQSEQTNNLAPAYDLDGNKNVADVIRAAPYNDSVGHYEYAPFGKVVTQVGTRAFDNPIRFSSEYADDTLELVYYNYRHYDVLSGKWLCFDRIDDALSPNSMLENRPLYAFDYLGLKICYRWMLITFYTGQKGPSRNSWNKNDLTEMDAAVGLAGWTYENGRAKKKGPSSGIKDYAYPPLTEFVIYRGRKNNSGGDRRTVRDGGSGWVYPRRGAPNGVAYDEWLDLWTKDVKGRGLEIDLVSMTVDDRCPCPKGWSQNRNVKRPHNLNAIYEASLK